MAKFTNELNLDVSPFLASIKKAQTAVGGLDESYDIQVDANVSEVKQLDKTLQDAADSASEVAQQSAGIGDALEEAGGKGSELGGFFDGLKGKLGGLGDLAGGAAGGLTSLVSAVPIPQVAAIGAAFAGVSAVIGGIVEKGREAEEAMRKLSIATGLTGDELEQLGDQASKAFEQGVGESVADATEKIGAVRAAFKGIVPDAELADATTKLDKFAQSFGTEVPDAASKIATVAKQFGISFDDAFNLVSQGAQNGVTDIGGYLDTLQEFSPNAKEAGLSAEQFFGQIAVASNESVKDLAKVGDGLKELNNRIKAGDLAAQVAEIGGAVGGQLQDIARLAEEGQITSAQAAQQAVEAINAARDSGEINESTRGQLFTIFGGSVAEDLGSELYSEIYGAPIDTDAIQKRAKEAGALIEGEIANQDPIEKLQRAFDSFITDIGSGLVSFYKEFVAPIINPIIDGFTRIKDAISEAFSGDGLKGAKSVFEGIQKTISAFVGFLVDRVVVPIEIAFSLIGEIFAAVGDAVQPIIDAFGEFGDAGDGAAGIFEKLSGILQGAADIFKKVLAVAVKIAAIPLQLVAKAIAGLIKFLVGLKDGIVNTVLAIRDWALSFDFVKDAIQGVVDFVSNLINTVKTLGSAIGEFLGIAEDAAEDAAEAQEKAADNTAKWQAEVKRLIVAHQLTDDAIEALAKTYNVAADEIRAFADANSAAFLTAAKDVNQLADNFNNALTAAQSNLSKYLAAVAGGAKEFTAQARAAQAEARKLEKAQDDAAFSIDPVRQKQVQAQRAQAAADTLKLERELTAQLITERKEREEALLKVQQEYDVDALDRQIEVQKALIAAGGAGGPEARAALEDLNQQRLQLLKSQEQQRVELEGQFARIRLDNLIDAEQKARDAATAINELQLRNLERQLAAFDLTSDTITQTIDAQTDAIKRGAEDQARALVESAPEFQKAYEEITRQVELKVITPEQAREQIDDLRRTLQDGLLAVAGDGTNPLADSLRAVFDNAEQDAKETARAIQDAFADAAVSTLRSDTVRSQEESVRALEKQRDTLLQNVKLTEEQRNQIETGFADAIDKVRRGPILSLQESVFSIADALSQAQFELDAEQAADDAENVAKQVEEINKLLAAGEISYQEALDRLRELEGASQDTAAVIGQAFTSALRTVADSTNELTSQSIAYLNQLADERRKIANDTTLTEEKKAEQLAQIDQKIADNQTKALEQIAANATLQFGAVLAETGDVGEALKTLAGDTAKSLLSLYTPSILGLFQSIIPPPFGLIAGTAAVGALQALLSAALAGFADGGYTGNGGRTQVAGVVHRGEFVVDAPNTRKYRPLLEAMQNGVDVERLLSSKGKAVDTRELTASLHGVTTIMAEVRDRLDAIPDRSLMRQEMGVQVALDDVLYEKRRFQKRVRSLR